MNKDPDLTQNAEPKGENPPALTQEDEAILASWPLYLQRLSEAKKKRMADLQKQS